MDGDYARIYNVVDHSREKYIQQHPYVGDDGIYTPVESYVPEGCAGAYKLIMTKEMFVEAYNKWIKGE